MRIGDDVAWTADESRVVALDLTQPGASPLVLESTSAVVWEEIAIRGPIEVDELLELLAQAFDVRADDIRRDVDSLLAELRSRRLLAG
ncbi:MAG: hypothetical protein BGN97_11270 [Microbacterium sp. 69-10]|nr:MAG: hypothetical protein BGN97_11270 [Microbacterium sp. 69-10]